MPYLTVAKSTHNGNDLPHTIADEATFGWIMNVRFDYE